VALIDLEEGCCATLEDLRRCSLAIDRGVFNFEVVHQPADAGFKTCAHGCRALSTIVDADGIDVRDWYAILQEIAKADAVSLQGEFHTGSELGKQLVGPARFKIELHVNDITRAPEDLCGFADLSQSLEFLVALMFKELLEPLLGHCFLRVHLQFGEPRVEFAADHLCLPMIRTMKGQ